MKFDSTLLYSADLQKSADFYTKLFSQQISPQEISVTFDIEGMHFQLFDEAKVHFKADSGQAKGAGVFFHLHVDDVDAEYQRLVDAGLQPSSEPTDRDWGNREFAIKDPDGYRWVFYKEIEG